MVGGGRLRRFCVRQRHKVNPDGWLPELPPALVVVVAYVSFLSMHPFRDANGRAGHALFHAVRAGSGTLTECYLPFKMIQTFTSHGSVGACGPYAEQQLRLASNYVH